MAKIPDTSLTQYSDGDKVYAIDYNKDREIMKVAINDIEDKLASTVDGKSGADHVKITPINGVVAGSVQEGLEGLKAQINDIQEGVIPEGSITDAMLNPTVIGSREYSGNYVISDKEPVGTSLNKLDLHLGSKELQFTTSNMTYYVNPNTGLDSVIAGTEGIPYRTIQYALNRLPKIINHNITIQLNPAVYGESPQIKGFMGSGSLKIKGNIDAPSNYVVPLITINALLDVHTEGITATKAYGNYLEAKIESHLADISTDFDEVITARNSGVKGKTFIVLDERLEELELEHVDSIKPFHFNHASQEYVNIDKFFEPLKNGKIYTTEFYQFDISPSSTGVKKDDNEGLICEPSTNTVRGRNDYEKIGLFMSIDVNAYVDENDDYHVIAIDGDGRFKRDGSMGDVYVMAMPGYQKRYETDTVWGISYSDTMHPGFEILGEAVKPDGTIRPYLLHAKYIAGRNPYENNNLASISGVYAEYNGMSHDEQIDKFKAKGIQYSGKTSHDDYYVQLMFWLKYATLNSDTIMKGCQSYYLQYTNLVAETGVKRVVVTNSQANVLLVGSTVSIGDYGAGSINVDRQVSQNYNLAERVNILDIVDLGDGNSAVYVDTENTFDTTLTTTITTYPWNSGGCDNVLGQDGSPYNNQSGKEPFIINGIEMIVGGYEVIQNKIIYNNNTDPDNYKIQLYVCYDCTKYSKGSPTPSYDLIEYELVQTGQTWKYISKIGIDPNHPSVLVPIEANASSTTGFGDAVYTNIPTTGYRVWRSLGFLSGGAFCGLRYLDAVYGLTLARWSILGRLSATGRSRRRAGVN